MKVMNILTLFMFTSADEVHFITKPHLIGNNILHTDNNPRAYFSTLGGDVSLGPWNP